MESHVRGRVGARAAYRPLRNKNHRNIPRSKFCMTHKLRGIVFTTPKLKLSICLKSKSRNEIVMTVIMCVQFVN